MNRSLFRSFRLFDARRWAGPATLLILLFAHAGLAGAQQRPADEVPPAAHGHRRAPEHAYSGRERYPGVEVYIAPETEHAPSNYVPDNYRLPDYDGRPDRPTFCAGESGTTISTRQTPCPSGQRPSTGGRTLSTSP